MTAREKSKPGEHGTFRKGASAGLENRAKGMDARKVGRGRPGDKKDRGGVGTRS